MGNNLRSIPGRKWRFIGSQSDAQKRAAQAEDPEKDMNDFKKKLRDRAKNRKS